MQICIHRDDMAEKIRAENAYEPSSPGRQRPLQLCAVSPFPLIEETPSIPPDRRGSIVLRAYQVFPPPDQADKDQREQHDRRRARTEPGKEPRPRPTKSTETSDDRREVAAHEGTVYRPSPNG